MANIKDVFDIEDLERHVELGFVSKRKHPDLPIYIYNYTEETTFSDRWNEVTMTCRGLILDEDYNIVSRPFRKFFNLETSSRPETQVQNLPSDIRPTITEKMDGSLGILWRYKGHEGIATRGSFTSEQAVWATNYFNRVKSLKFDWEKNPCIWRFDFGQDNTPLFEIIYPENRIVVDYHGESKLTLLGIVRNNDGSEYDYQELRSTGYPDIVTVYEGRPLDECVSASETDRPVNTEGYVASFDTKLYPLRVKIKFQEYLRLHRLIFSLNDRRIWESLSQGKDPMADMERIPKDVSDWIRLYVGKFKDGFIDIYNKSANVFNSRPVPGNRKDYAAHFCRYPDVQDICFALLDGQNIDQIIWKKLRPEQAKIFRRISYDQK